MPRKQAHKIFGPLSEEDWRTIRALDWRIINTKQIVEFFYQNGNEAIRLKELVKILYGSDVHIFAYQSVISTVASMFSKNNLPFTFGALPEDYGMLDRRRVCFFKAERR